MLSRYGDEIEIDLAFHTSYRLSQFLRGEEHPNVLYNLCRAFQQRRDSYLRQAILLDEERYEEYVRIHGEPKARRAEPPALVEVDLPTSLLMTMVDILGKVLYYVSSQSPKGTNKPKNKPMPRPRTAADIYKSRKARETYEHLQGVLVFVPDEQWKRNISEARARGEA